MPINELAPVSNIQSASQFHAISWVDVVIDPDPKNKDVYKQGSSGYGQDKVDLYALSNVALARLMNAAGIEETGSHRTDTREHPHVCSWQFSARYVQPDSTVLSYSADYELDLRDYINVNGSTFRGARFDKALVDERVALVYEENKEKWGKLWGDNLNKKADAFFGSLPDSEKKRLDDMAEGKALRYVVQMRQFIVQRAQTGAMERAVRKMLNLKSAYTLAELKNPFRVPRSRFDWDRLDKAIGKDAGQELRQLEAMKVLGIDVSTYQQFRQLNAPAQSRVPVETTVPQQEVVEGIVTEAVKVTPEAVETEVPEEVNSFHGVAFKSLDDVVGNALNSDPLKAWYKINIVDKLKPQQHYSNHLKMHFGKSSALNLTWREIIAMDDNVNNGVEYPPQYHPREEKKAEKKETKAPAGDLDGRLESSGLNSILSSLKLDKTDANVLRVLEDMIRAVEAGAFDPKTDEGRAEIETYLAQEIH